MKYKSAPQQHLFGNRTMNMISGKLLGGTSRINNGLYTRCFPAEFHDWGSGWDFKKMEELYNRSEGNPKKTNATGEWKTRIIEPFFKSSNLYLYLF
jgi:choline dehydrogenase-like flavoprotein